MGIIDKLFGRGREEEQTLERAMRSPAFMPPMQSASPAKTIQYDQTLVPQLIDDHHALVAMYQKLGNDVRSGRYQGVATALLDFKTYLEGHLLKENVRFYVYLEQSMAHDAENLALVKDFRREMNGIARGVVDFVKKYQVTPVSHATQNEFLADYDAVGQLLAMRIGREESQLYTLYHD